MDRRLWSRTKGIENIFVCAWVNWLFLKRCLETQRRWTWRSPVTELWLISDSSAVGVTCRAACSDFSLKKEQCKEKIYENLIYIIKCFPSVSALSEMFWYTTLTLCTYYQSYTLCFTMHRRTFLSKWFHKVPLTSAEAFCFTKGSLCRKKVLQIIKRWGRYGSLKNLWLNGSLWNQKWFFYGIAWSTFIFQSVYSARLEFVHSGKQYHP